MTFTDVWQTSPELPRLSVAESLSAVARAYGKRPLDQVRELARLAFSSSNIQPEEYFYYRLFEDRYDAGLQRAFVGRRLEDKLHRLTCEPGSWIVAHDKLICYGLLRSLGYPVPETQAVYRRGAAFPGVASLGGRDDLAAALRGGLALPLFGKPVRGIRSAGVLRIEGYDRASDSLQLAHGHAVAVDEVVPALETYADDGYLFQQVIRQHPAVTAVCGDAVATVRLVVLLRDDGPEIHRAVWKLPAGGNVADNFWRDGNVLAALEPATGRVVRAVQGVGPDLREVAAHPTTGAALDGFTLPGWRALRALVLSAAHAFPELRMQAWDVAVGADGPVLVEVNVGGDYTLPQLATGHGMIDDRFLAFLEECAAKRGLEPDLAKLKLTAAG